VPCHSLHASFCVAADVRDVSPYKSIYGHLFGKNFYTLYRQKETTAMESKKPSKQMSLCEGDEEE